MPKGARVFKGQRLKKVRKALGLTQSDFDDIGIQQSQMTKYERNEEDPSLDTIYRLAIKLNTSADYLLGLADEPNKVFAPADMTPDEAEVTDIVGKNGAKRSITALSKPPKS